MPFVKLDCGILDSTIWIDREARELFITALLMGVPCQTTEHTAQLEVRSLAFTGWRLPPGDYGFVAAAGTGIIRRAGIEQDAGLAALERLGSPEAESRSQDYEGRRMIRVDGGYLILNFDRYRQKDHTAAKRSQRYRERKALRRDTVASRVTVRSATQAEADSEAEAYKAAEAAAFDTSECPRDMDPKKEHQAFCLWCGEHGKAPTATRWTRWVRKGIESNDYAKQPKRPPTREEIAAEHRKAYERQQADA